MSNQHPIQEIVLDKHGRLRFRENSIVKFLLEQGPFELNQISKMNFSNEDYTQLMQLIGYSVDGYGMLSTSPPEIVEVADQIAETLRKEGK